MFIGQYIFCSNCSISALLQTVFLHLLPIVEMFCKLSIQNGNNSYGA